MSDSKKNVSPFGRTRGFTLISVLVGVALVGLFIFLATSYFGSTANMNAHVQSSEALIGLRNQFLENLSCPRTVATRPPGCNSSNSPFVAILGKANNTIVNNPMGSGSYTTSGTYSLRARCLSCSYCSGGMGIFVEYMVQNATAPAKSFLTPAPLVWEDLLDGQLAVACVVPPS
jgi:type II secretory pathway pseudopilin PulG